MEKRQKSNLVIPVLFALYVALLVWIILFKLQFSIHDLDFIRKINFIPFYDDGAVSARLHRREVLENVMIFVPFGIYLCMLRHEPRFSAKAAILFGTSFSLEVAQYILGVGCSDITDLITNTSGGILGIGTYYAAIKLFHNRERINGMITVLAAAVTVIVIGGLAFLLLVNR